MRRYGAQSQRVTIPGQDAGLRLTLQPTQRLAGATCEPDLGGLFWFSDETGLFDQEAEAATLAAEDAASPVLAVARLVGERCGRPVTWATTWTPAEGEGGDPGLAEEGADLMVYQLAMTVAGTLLVSATCEEQTFGPIALILMAASSAGSCAPFDSTLELKFLNATWPIYLTAWYDGTPCFYANVNAGNDFDSRDVSTCASVNQTGVNNRSFRAGNSVIFQPSAGMYSFGADDNGVEYREIGVDFPGGHQTYTIDFAE